MVEGMRDRYLETLERLKSDNYHRTRSEEEMAQTRRRFVDLMEPFSEDYDFKCGQDIGEALRSIVDC